jgi:hypothetical protein
MNLRSVVPQQKYFDEYQSRRSAQKRCAARWLPGVQDPVNGTARHFDKRKKLHDRRARFPNTAAASESAAEARSAELT